jgi:hypothetical protein
MQDHLVTVARDDKMPSLASREQKQAIRWIVLVQDHTGLGKVLVRGSGQDRVDLARRQARETARSESIGKTDNPRIRQKFAAALHSLLLSEMGRATSHQRRFVIPGL